MEQNNKHCYPGAKIDSILEEMRLQQQHDPSSPSNHYNFLTTKGNGQNNPKFVLCIICELLLITLYSKSGFCSELARIGFKIFDAQNEYSAYTHILFSTTKILARCTP